MNKPKVTIIVLNYNGITDTRKCLKTLLETNYPNFKIIVADNGSDKNEAKLLTNEFANKKIAFVRFEKNFGFSGGNNRVLQKVKTKYVVLLNNDTEVTRNWLSPLIEIMEKDKKVAVVQPKILWTKNKKYFDYTGACGGYIDLFGYPFTRGRIFNTIEADNGQYDSIVDIFWASGAAMFIRKSVLEQIGLFDETFFNYMEEIDLCYRIHQAGFKVICQPKSYIYHKVASTASKNAMKKRFWEHRNNLLFILKNYSLVKLAIILPIRLAMDYLSILYYLYSRNINYALGALLGQISFFFFFPKIILQRISKKQNNIKKTGDIIYKNSIVLSYFVIKKQKFSQLL